MGAKIDLTGHRYGKLTVLSGHDITTNRKHRWICKCDCGTEIIAIGGDMRSGRQVSCGCVRDAVNRDRMRATYFIHGLSHTPVGRSWRMMMYRCYDKKCKQFKDYGGRGIMVCRFLMESPENLLEILGNRPPSILSLDRPDNHAGYTCGKCEECIGNGWTLNVRWATQIQQSRNQRTNRIIDIGGTKRCVAEWAEISGINRITIRERLKRGWHGLKLLQPADLRFCAK